MLAGLWLVQRRFAVARLPHVRAGVVQAYHASSLDNTNRLEDGGAAALSPAFLENKRCMDGLVHHLHKLIGQTTLGGGQKAIERHKSRGKMLPRDRIAALLDSGSPFLELSQLAGHQLYGMRCLQSAVEGRAGDQPISSQILCRQRRSPSWRSGHRDRSSSR